jgi:hypothetical protein
MIGGKTPKYISCGASHTLVLMTDGTIWGTGFNNNGQLGIGNTTDKQILTQMNTSIIEGRTPQYISCTALNSYVLMTDKTIWGTGNNSFGQLGIAVGDITRREILTQMGPNNTNIKYIAGMTPEDDIIANICVPAGTPVLTDQGIIHIDKINPAMHTINQQKIVDITKTISTETFLVSFEKDALGIDMPSQETRFSQSHHVLYENAFYEAKWFLTQEFSGVKKVPYTGETLYNVLLEEHDFINVNNLICETLRPDNIIAKLYTKQCKLSSEYRDEMIKVLKNCLDRSDFASYTKTLQCC